MRFLLDHDVPEDLTYLIRELQHEVVRLRDVLAADATDLAILELAFAQDSLLMRCNRDDFLKLAGTQPHHGIIVVIRRKARALERAALLRLLERAGETGLRDNINFA